MNKNDMIKITFNFVMSDEAVGSRVGETAVFKVISRLI